MDVCVHPRFFFLFLSFPFSFFDFFCLFLFFYTQCCIFNHSIIIATWNIIYVWNMSQPLFPNLLLLLFTANGDACYAKVLIIFVFVNLLRKKKGESGTSTPGSGSTAASPAPQRRLQRVEILKIAEGTPLIDPTEVVVSQGAVLIAEPVLTPLGITFNNLIDFERGE